MSDSEREDELLGLLSTTDCETEERILREAYGDSNSSHSEYEMESESSDSSDSNANETVNRQRNKRLRKKQNNLLNSEQSQSAEDSSCQSTANEAGENTDTVIHQEDNLPRAKRFKSRLTKSEINKYLKNLSENFSIKYFGFVILL